MHASGKLCPLPISRAPEPLRTGQTKARHADNGYSMSKYRNAGMARTQGFPPGDSLGHDLWVKGKSS